MKSLLIRFERVTSERVLKCIKEILEGKKNFKIIYWEEHNLIRRRNRVLCNMNLNALNEKRHFTIFVIL